MRAFTHSLICLAAVFAAACGQTNQPSGQQGDQASQSAPAAAASAAAQSAPAPAACDPPAVGIAVGAPVQSQLQATSRPYPANATYYCFAAPAGAQSLTISLTGLAADLDLYVGHGSITTVQGVDLSRGDTYQWKSNDFGSGDEHVTINQPQPGIYYIEIASYEGQASPFTLSVR
jgi:hypothetical protein